MIGSASQGAQRGSRATSAMKSASVVPIAMWMARSGNRILLPLGSNSSPQANAAAEIEASAASGLLRIAPPTRQPMTAMFNILAPSAAIPPSPNRNAWIASTALTVRIANGVPSIMVA